MQHRVASQLGGPAAEVVNVVVLEGDLVIGTGEVHVPVVVAVAGGRVGHLAVKVAVGDADPARGALAQDDVLPSDLVGGYMVDPDQVRSGKGDGIAAPYILGVQLGDADVLDDDVLDAVGHAKALALDHARRAVAEDGLVRSHLDGGQASVVVAHGHSRGIRLVVGAPVVLVDGLLAGIAGTPGRTSTPVGRALGSGEVESLLEDDDTRRGVLEVGDPVAMS